MWPSPVSPTLRTRSTGMPADASVLAVPAVATGEAQPGERRSERNRLRLVGVANRQERGAAAGKRPARRPFGLRERAREVEALAITSPVERISGPSTGSAPEADEQEHGR